MQCKNKHIFDRSGFAALSDLQSQEWRLLFESLEVEQSQFLSMENIFRSPDYKWPRDPLHTWSRVWEYPYVFHQLYNLRRNKEGGDLLKVADIGSGVTFFPFSVARLGYDVTCIDIDPVCAVDIPVAGKAIEHKPGHVDVGLIMNGRIPLDDCSQDAVYCISVLEHVQDFQQTISEIYRILKPGGVFILTVDIDLRGDFELGVDDFSKLQNSFQEKFLPVLAEQSIHPADLLTTCNSSFGSRSRSMLTLFKGLIKHIINKWRFFGDLDVNVYLTVYARTLSKHINLN